MAGSCGHSVEFDEDTHAVVFCGHLVGVALTPPSASPDAESVQSTTSRFSIARITQNRQALSIASSQNTRSPAAAIDGVDLRSTSQRAESWTTAIAEIVSTPRERSSPGLMPEEVPHPRH